MPSTIVAIMMDVKGNQNMHVNQNCLRGKPHHALSSPNPLDNDILKRNSSGLSDFSDYVDLVKRHLMYAVREEVEILKQQIGEMMDRIGQLEYENTVLRSEARPETLNKLLQPRLTQSSQNSVPNQNTSTVTATKLQQTSTHPVSLPLQQVTQQST